ncbi:MULTISPECIES: glycine oxidase ThiO [unclassified Rhizobium]|uniref:glycine oxidase ThiO n=1 Tax=unclassified Rhizobium TaxID=2613769 RepID=UPI000715BFF5|nr:MULTISPECIES: glycine oxidase ThiO [unclassified Rhizobium]KQS88026.1 glycine oxidase [Rhizobium sp. Leaf386]KQS94418.1 glycine oxidase [Rhizobium sp. Leaf391]KQU01423.1 glycine oxidase [Rhizobium sp. Leaf453]
MRVLIRGAGVAGLTLAHELASSSINVVVTEKANRAGGGASWFAGGMLAPWCERENAPGAVLQLGQTAADWWDAVLPGHVKRKGTLVVAPPRDTADLVRFASRTSGFDWLKAEEIDALEPSLAGRFGKALYFAHEAHLDPRRAINALHEKLVGMGVCFRFDAPDFPEKGFDRVIDCTGARAIGNDPRLRGVRGEMLVLETLDVQFSRPVRLLHPRIPLYIVPRTNNRFMVGATMIESDDSGPVSARSLMELLNAAYALHPAFGEARVIETGSGVRPAYPDNLPAFSEQDGMLRVNGFYRHGFLLAPAIARMAAERLLSSRAGKSEGHTTFAPPVHRQPDSSYIGASQ